MAGRITRGEIRQVRFPPPDKQPSCARPHTRLGNRVLVPGHRGASDDGLKQPSAVNLHNIVTVDKSRVGRRVAALADERMRAVCGALGFALGCTG